MRESVLQEPERGQCQTYLLGLLAKIKCSICSYQLNLWYLLHGNK